MNKVSVIKRIIDIEEILLQQGYIEPPFTDGHSWLECFLLVSREDDGKLNVVERPFYHVYADGYEDTFDVEQMNQVVQNYLSEEFPDVHGYDWEWITESTGDDDTTNVLGIKVVRCLRSA